MAYAFTLMNGVAAFLLVILGMVVGKIASNILKRFLKSVEMNALVHGQLKVQVPLEEYLPGVVRYVVSFVGAMYALKQLGVPVFVLVVLFTVVMVLAIIFTVLALKDYIPNMIAGMYIRRSQKLKVGDVVHVKNVKGEIMHMGLLETKVKAKDEIVFIPNSLLNRSEIMKKDGVH